MPRSRNGPTRSARRRSAARASSRPSWRWRGSNRRRPRTSRSTRSLPAAVEVAAIFHPLVRYRALARSAAEPSGDLGRSRPAQPGADQSPGQRRAGAARLGRPTADNESRPELHPKSGNVIVACGRHRARESPRKSCRASSSRSSRRRKSAREPASACRFAIASCNRMAGPSRSKPREGGGSAFVVALPASSRPDDPAEIAVEDLRDPAGSTAWWSTTKRRSAN